MTVGELRRQIAELEDDIEIVFNVDGEPVEIKTAGFVPEDEDPISGGLSKIDELAVFRTALNKHFGSEDH